MKAEPDREWSEGVRNATKRALDPQDAFITGDPVLAWEVVECLKFFGFIPELEKMKDQSYHIKGRTRVENLGFLGR
jgi:hypothetical protein